ncbi:dihydrodipicolinate synthase family protein [Virgibacillus doumboii]|uniref:dihydrodipicolinate synthase family protein n=1 Tax=Virgibacillus doumboii TaxID=2697503 RepID=UPI0013E00B64|nr:dihydrodipicolinate synthase family protein [Virgibacillus doumboii]
MENTKQKTKEAIMDVKKFEGIYPAVITPFTPEGEVDEGKLRAYIQYLVTQVDGLFVCGSYGSGPIMRIDQRKKVAEITMEVVEGEIPVILHVGCPDTESTVELAKHADSINVDAVAAVTPYYYKHQPNLIVNHYKSIIESVNVPVIIYNNPKYSNFSVPGDMLAELAELGVKGVKDSSGDISLFYEYMTKVKRSDFLFLIGSQTHLVPAVVGGAHGCVSGLSNAFPNFIKEIYQACKDEKFEKAVKLQKKANNLRSVTGSGIPVPFYHAALPMLGIELGVPRKPFQQLPQEELERIEESLSEAKMLLK